MPHTQKIVNSQQKNTFKKLTQNTETCAKFFLSESWFYRQNSTSTSWLETVAEVCFLLLFIVSEIIRFHCNLLNSGKKESDAHQSGRGRITGHDAVILKKKENVVLCDDSQKKLEIQKYFIPTWIPKSIWIHSECSSDDDGGGGGSPGWAGRRCHLLNFLKGLLWLLWCDLEYGSHRFLSCGLL